VEDLDQVIAIALKQASGAPGGKGKSGGKKAAGTSSKGRKVRSAKESAEDVVEAVGSQEILPLRAELGGEANRSQ
jgi:hypothetical protein